jgi:acyl carrier protein
MANKEELYEIIYEALEDINSTLPKNKQIKNDPSEILFGSEGKLDSLGLVNLIVQLENLIDDKYDKSITIADEKAMSEHRSPFRSIDSLAEYAVTLLNTED